MSNLSIYQRPAARPHPPTHRSYTYKNWEAVHQGPEAAASLPGQVVLRKKGPARPTLQQLQSTMESMTIGPGGAQQQ